MTRRRIILTALIGTLALSTLAVSLTLAWYGASNLLSVNTFDLEITGNSTLKVSTKQEKDSFREEITSDQLKAEEKSFLFEPVSSMCKDTWMNEQKDMPVFYKLKNDAPNADIPFAEAATAENSAQYGHPGFFSKKIYMLSTISYYVSIDPDETKTYFINNSDANFSRAQTIYTDIKKQDPDTTVTVNEIKDSLDNLKNCLRVSILVNIEGNYKYYIIDPWKDEVNKTVFGGVLDNDGNGYFDTYTDVSEGITNKKEKETVYGEVNDRSLLVYNNPLHSTPQPGDNEPAKYDPYFGNCFEGENKDTAYTFDAQGSYANGMRFAEEESISMEDLKRNESLIKIPCYKDVVTEIVISVYLEGWDKQCINATMGASFESKISFKLNGGIV